MKWLPFHRFEIVSPLDRQAALDAMKAHTEPENWFRFGGPRDNARFEGEISGEGFHVRRIIGYRNSFLPVIDAKVHGGASGSRIEVQMRMFLFVYAFCAVWIVGVLTAVIAGGTTGLLIGGPMLLFLWAMTMIGFWIEAGKQEQTLRTIFKAA